MKIKLSTGEEIEIRFEHWTAPHYMQRNWATFAFIVDVETGKVLHDGKSRIHPKDNFCKVAGRKVALRKALVNYERPLRKEIWKALLGSGMRVE